MSLEDDGLMLTCPGDHAPALLRTEYSNAHLNPQTAEKGLFRYREWLPVARTYENAAHPVVYKAKNLGKALGLQNLWIAFNGYWPEIGAMLATATFKEFEAYTVLGRLPRSPLVLTVASSGNTAAAFAWVCSREGTPCIIIVPGNGLHRLSFQARLNRCVNVIVIDDGDYPDAMELASAVSRESPFCAEGGVRNVARRDGLGVVLLAALEEMKCLPSYYFQAVGSGTGAIAVLEASKRVRGMDPGMPLPRMMLCQNRPFTPIYDAWQGKSRSLSDVSAGRLRSAIKEVMADELTNWLPPYEIRGGVHDILAESNGDVMVADNASVQAAKEIVLELEGIDIEPAAAVAVACLRDAAVRGVVDRASVILLNVTGGGRLRLRQDYSLIQAEPRLRLTRRSLSDGSAVNDIKTLYEADTVTVG